MQCVFLIVTFAFDTSAGCHKNGGASLDQQVHNSSSKSRCKKCTQLKHCISELTREYEKLREDVARLKAKNMVVTRRVRQLQKREQGFRLQLAKRRLKQKTM